MSRDPDDPGPGPRPLPGEPPLVTPAFIALFVAALAFFTAGTTVLPVATRFAAGPLGADSVGVGVGIGAFAVAALAMRPIVGVASDRYGRRPLLLFGGAVSAVALGAHLVADSLATFVAVRALLGVGEAFFFVSMLAAVSDLAPSTRRGESINIGSLSVYLGLAAGPFIGETILAASSFDVVWVVAAAMALVATGLVILVPETAPSVLAPAPGPRVRSRLLHPAGVLPGVLILTGTWGMAGLFAFIPLYATEVGMDGAGLPLAVYALIVVVLRLVFAKLPDRIGAARLSSAALAVSAVGLAAIGVLDGPVGLMIGTIVFAGGIAFMFPALMALAVSRVDPSERGSVVGTTSAFVDLSFGLAPAILGLVVDGFGFEAAFLLSAVIAGLGALLLVSRRHTIAAPVGHAAT